jgi:hypothetical protein
MTELASNVLYYGDNLDILRRHLPDAAVDLVYLDRPSPPTATTTSSSATRRPIENTCANQARD